MATIDGSLITNNSIPGVALKNSAEVLHTQMKQRSNQGYPITIEKWRTWDAMHTNLPGTPATDDLGITTGTWGTDDFTIETGDLKAAGATTRYAACMVAVPSEYEDAQTVTIRVRAAMETTVSDTTATIDFELYRPDGDGTLSADLVTTSATSINSLTPNDYDFAVTATTIVGGDILLLRMAIAVNDAATGTAVTGVVYDCSMLYDTRG